ncbi:19508_t:CDS:2, partial [Funneliformis geosporum]
DQASRGHDSHGGPSYDGSRGCSDRGGSRAHNGHRGRGDHDGSRGHGALLWDRILVFTWDIETQP